MSKPIGYVVVYFGHQESVNERFLFHILYDTEEAANSKVARWVTTPFYRCPVVHPVGVTPTDAGLREAARDCADELEAEVEDRYLHTKDHPAMRPRYDRDMEAVIAVRAALSPREVENESGT